jgi:DNA-binding MarR family transcriptional regulator
VTATASTLPTGERVADVATHLRLAITRTARRLRQEAGPELSPSQASALATIGRHGPLTPSELADRERIKRPSATRVAARLEEEGLIERVPAPADGRSCSLRLTADGGTLIRRLRRRKTAFLADRLRALDSGELATLERASELLEGLLEDQRS